MVQEVRTTPYISIQMCVFLLPLTYDAKLQLVKTPVESKTKHNITKSHMPMFITNTELQYKPKSVFHCTLPLAILEILMFSIQWVIKATNRTEIFSYLVSEFTLNLFEIKVETSLTNSLRWFFRKILPCLGSRTKRLCTSHKRYLICWFITLRGGNWGGTI